MFELHTYLQEQTQFIETVLERHLPRADTRPHRLHEAMRYCIFAGGKRLRPILALAAADAVGGDREAAALPAAALEILHTYTLVHDDLPCMDDDDLRRGKPTVHAAYDEATAVLVGDALLTLAFEWMAECPAPPPYLPNRLVLELARAAGTQGVIGGQIEDLAAEGQMIPEEALLQIHSKKTGALIKASVRIGVMAVGGRPQALDALTMYGGDIGLAFQIVDDILDATSDTATLGKTAGSDERAAKSTYVSLHGIEEARTRAEALIDNAILQLADLHGDTAPLEAIARHILERKH